MAEQTTVDQAEVDHLAAVITDARLNHGISAGGWSLARHILAAGYRRAPDPPPVRYGECRVCTGTHPLGEEKPLDEHDNERGGPCLGAGMPPVRLVDPPQGGDDR